MFFLLFRQQQNSAAIEKRCHYDRNFTLKTLFCSACVYSRQFRIFNFLRFDVNLPCSKRFLVCFSALWSWALTLNVGFLLYCNVSINESVNETTQRLVDLMLEVWVFRWWNEWPARIQKCLCDFSKFKDSQQTYHPHMNNCTRHIVSLTLKDVSEIVGFFTECLKREHWELILIKNRRRVINDNQEAANWPH